MAFRDFTHFWMKEACPRLYFCFHVTCLVERRTNNVCLLVCLSVIVILYTTFYSTALSKCSPSFPLCKVKSCIIGKKPHHQKIKTRKGVCPSQASHWTALYFLGFAEKNDTKKVSVSLPMYSNCSNNAATSLGSSHHSDSQFHMATNWPWLWLAVA